MKKSIAKELNECLCAIVINSSTCLRMLSANPQNVEGALETARRTIRSSNRAAETARSGACSRPATPFSSLRLWENDWKPRMERVQLNGADIEYDARGSGAPVVFIHGAILSDGFVPVIEQTGIAENFQIVHYRRRGYAGSSRAVAGMTMQGWAGDCIALLNHLGIESAHVAGHCCDISRTIERIVISAMFPRQAICCNAVCVWDGRRMSFMIMRSTTLSVYPLSSTRKPQTCGIRCLTRGPRSACCWW